MKDLAARKRGLLIVSGIIALVCLLSPIELPIKILVMFAMISSIGFYLSELRMMEQISMMRKDSPWRIFTGAAPQSGRVNVVLFNGQKRWNQTIDSVDWANVAEFMVKEVGR